MDILPKSAWEPVTPRGVAAFARATLGRLLLVQFVVALLTVAATGWLLYDGVYPTVTAAVQKLPDTGEIRSARLNWRGEPEQLLAESRLLSISVDLDHSGKARSGANVHAEFGRDSLRMVSLLGYADFAYPAGWIIAANRPELEPKWGAWQPPFLALVILGGLIYLMIVWALLATLYAVPVWLYGFYLNRDLGLAGSWKIGGASLMPGALMVAASLLVYDFAWIDLVHVLFIGGAHMLVGWAYLAIAPLFLPRHPAASSQRANPFTPPKT